MPDVNAAFQCLCGSTRFIELAQWNALNCRLQADPEHAPVMILCWACWRIYKQAPDWSWQLQYAEPEPRTIEQVRAQRRIDAHAHPRLREKQERRRGAEDGAR